MSFLARRRSPIGGLFRTERKVPHVPSLSLYSENAAGIGWHGGLDNLVESVVTCYIHLERGSFASTCTASATSAALHPPLRFALLRIALTRLPDSSRTELRGQTEFAT